MVSVHQASEIILGNLFRPKIASVNVSDAVGKILAEPVSADRDLPPFNRVSMDGIAIMFDEWAGGRRLFKVERIQAAGEPANPLNNSHHCIEVMTGAVLPGGCDTVIRYEDLHMRDGEAHVEPAEVQRWQNVHLQGSDAKLNERLLQPPLKLGPPEVALLASTGKSSVRVFDVPHIAVISTGDELVDVGDVPKPWQVRRSNAYAVQAALRVMGMEARCFHLRDEPAALKAGLDSILQDHDILILSGGVSKGKFDYVPEALEAAGIRKLFHQVSQRPGKPFWFGNGSEKTAFALPGNPVSTFMCFHKYVKPWIYRSLGWDVNPSFAVLGNDFTFAPPVTYFLQVSVRNEGGTLVATPVPGGGSGDFANLKNVDGFLEMPLEKSDFKRGEVFPFVAFRH